MGAKIDFTQHIHISKRSSENGVLKYVGYKDITLEVIDEIAQNERIKWIQINENLPDRAYQEIDRILAGRPDLYFRVFGIGTYGNETFDLSVLGQMPHLSRVRIDGHLKKNREAVNPEYLCKLPNLKGVHLTLFDYLDYSFIKELTPDLEELILSADTMGKAVQFDCEWLSNFEKLHTLFLGKKAKKHIGSIGRISSLKSLSLNGIKVEDFSFLKKLNLEFFALLWCGNSDLTTLGDLTSLRKLELWRVMKLDNLDFIRNLVNLETLKLQDLKHITTLPDLKNLTKLADIQIDNVPIDLESLDESVRKLVHS
ncbi:MAG: hypothetical protein K2O15_01555 [Lachnospiraceae bacterium]|nr:hypothetical protein [Lachnospiraceae bacterium]